MGCPQNGIAVLVCMEDAFVFHTAQELRSCERRRVGNAVRQPMYPLPNRLVRAFNAYLRENRCCLSE